MSFVDPKGLRNIRGFEDPKIQLYKLLKSDIEPRLNDPDIVLDSFIVSNSPYEEIRFWNRCETDKQTPHEGPFAETPVRGMKERVCGARGAVR